MNILAIDTSTENLSLALLVGEELFTFNQVVKNQQSTFIIPEISTLLVRGGVSLDELDTITYNQGPGSFTGLRIGLSVVLGIAYAKQIDVVPIPAFYAYLTDLLDSPVKQNIVVAIDARLNQVYLAGIIAAKSYQYFIQPMLIKPEEIEINNDDYICIGNGFSQYYEQLPSAVKLKVLMNQGIYPQASTLIHLVRSNKFGVVSIDGLGLLYLRDKVALNLDEQKQLKL
jgi:tRNA threonylcarbamoyladenosine biosynthesis protein TsaB